MEAISKFEKDLEKKNISNKLMPPPNQREKRKSGVIDLNAKEIVLRSKIEELFKKFSF